MQPHNTTRLWAILLCLLLTAAPALLQAAPYKIWQEAGFNEHAAGPSGNIYYGGGVFDDTFYTGQIQYGPQQWGTAPQSGTALLNKADKGTLLAKSATLLNGFVYCGGMVTGGIYRMSGWDPDTIVDLGYTFAESLVTDGTFLYSNNSSVRNQIHKFKVNEDGSVSQVWAVAIGGANNRFRGVSYYNGKLYVAEHNAESKSPEGDRGIYEIDAGTGDYTRIATVPSTGGANAYQVVRYGNRMYLVGLDDMLRTYELHGSTWDLVSSDDLGVTDIYGIGVRGDGTRATHFWVTHLSRSISYFILDVNDAPVVPVGKARTEPDTTLLALKNVAVTALTGDGFFVQEQDRSAGIRVKWSGAQPAADALASLIGTVQTDGHERVISAMSVTPGAAYVAEPLGVNNGAAGGAAAAGGAGLPNDGLLVTVWGKVTAVDYGSPAFYVDDGSGVPNDTPNDFVFEAVPGIKVQSTGDFPWTGAYLKVTGVLRLQDHDGKAIRRVDIRSWSDVEQIDP